MTNTGETGLEILETKENNSTFERFYPFRSSHVTVGRDAACDVALPFASVSRRHVSIAVTQLGTFEVRCLTDNSATYIFESEGSRRISLSRGVGHEVPAAGCLLQLGGVLLRLGEFKTVGLFEPMRGQGDRDPRLVVRWNGDNCEVSIHTWSLGLAGDRARFLGLIAGDCDHHHDIERDLLPHLNADISSFYPLVSVVRSAFRRALDAGYVPRNWLVGRVQEAGHDVSSSTSDEELMRMLVHNRQNLGYRLCIRNADVVRY